MVDALKTFAAGEKIKASETNSNNQYLLNLISESASALQVYLANEVEKLQGNFKPVGALEFFPFASVPLGYLVCDGASYLREDYPDLFAAIGTIYGAVDDYHFNVPDYRGLFLRGAGGTNSANLGIKQKGALPDHRHDTFRAFNSRVQLGTDNGRSYGSIGDSFMSGYASADNPIYTSVNEVRPDNMSVIIVIKY